MSFFKVHVEYDDRLCFTRGCKLGFANTYRYVLKKNKDELERIYVSGPGLPDCLRSAIGIVRSSTWWSWEESHSWSIEQILKGICTYCARTRCACLLMYTISLSRKRFIRPFETQREFGVLCWWNLKLRCIAEEGVYAGIYWLVHSLEVYEATIWQTWTVASMVVPDHWSWVRCWITSGKPLLWNRTNWQHQNHVLLYAGTLIDLVDPCTC